MSHRSKPGIKTQIIKKSTQVKSAKNISAWKSIQSHTKHSKRSKINSLVFSSNFPLHPQDLWHMKYPSHFRGLLVTHSAHHQFLVCYAKGEVIIPELLFLHYSGPNVNRGPHKIWPLQPPACSLACCVDYTHAECAVHMYMFLNLLTGH